MRYLIIHPDKPPLISWYYDPGTFVDGMTVYDISARIYTIDGIRWKNISENE